MNMDIFMISCGKLPDTVAAVSGGSSLVWYYLTIMACRLSRAFSPIIIVIFEYYKKLNFALSVICDCFHIPNWITIQNQFDVGQRIVTDQPV